MCVVQVQMHDPDSNKVLDTYSILDNCSQGPFVKEEIIATLDITGTDTRVTEERLNGEISQRSPLWLRT